MKAAVTCDGCKADGFWKRLARECLACGEKVELCPECADTYTTCSEACRNAWRDRARTILTEPLATAGTRKRVKKEPDQLRLFG